MTFTPLFEFFGILSDVNAFLVFFILIGAGAGAFSRKLSITAYGALLVYVHIVMKTDLFIFDAILYIVLIVILLWASTYVVSGYLESKSEAV